jgi:3-hexulose-6-phosphate synthase
MKLQLALDGTLQRGLSILAMVRPYVDIAEIGTPLLLREGMAAARKLQSAFPNLPLSADMKIVDAGEQEAEIAFEAGCSYVSVLGLASEETIIGALRAARRRSGGVVVDMLQVPDLIPRARTLLALGCHLLCIHTPHDLVEAGADPLRDLTALRDALPDAPLAVAGGIGPDAFPAIAALRPQVVIVGSAITGAPDPAAAARAIRDRMEVR